MPRKLKLDLHTHPVEALRDKMHIKGIHDINLEVAEAVVKAIKSAGLDGIAVTEHNNFNHGLSLSLTILDNFRHEKLIILPGSEIDYNGQQFLQIYVPDYIRRQVPFFQGREWFYILAHPGHYNPFDINQFARLDFDGVEVESLHGNFSLAEEVSSERGIPVVKSSDAHNLNDLGFRFIELESNFPDRAKRRA